MSSRPFILIFCQRKTDISFFSQYNKQFTILPYLLKPTATLDDMLSDIEAKFPNIDGVISLADKSSIVASFLAKERGIIGPSPISVINAQNKAVCTQIFAKVCSTFPPFSIITDSNLSYENIPFPAFMKPVKGVLSKKSYKVENEEDIAKYFYESDLVHDPFVIWHEDAFLKITSKKVNLNAFILQPYICAPQYTVDAFVYKNRVSIIGITRSVMTPDNMSFERFEHPATFNYELYKSLEEILERIILELGFDNSFFNLEFFVQDNSIIPIEFNTRVAHQFVPLFQEWYKQDLYEQMISLSLGEKPSLSVKSHPMPATSFVLRTKKDSLVTYVPNKEEIKEIQKRFNLLEFIPLVKKGKKLSDFTQDSYSFRYGLVNIAGSSSKEIKIKFDVFSKNVPIQVQEIDQTF